MKRNLNHPGSFHPGCFHWCELDQADIKPEILAVVLVGSHQLIVFHNSSVEEQLVQVAALVELLQLLVSLHSLGNKLQEILLSQFWKSTKFWSAKARKNY